jgi:hypothetical protein
MTRFVESRSLNSALVTHIWEVRGSNLGLETGLLTGIFHSCP